MEKKQGGDVHGDATEVIIPYTMPEGVTSTQLREINRAIDEFHMKTFIR